MYNSEFLDARGFRFGLVVSKWNQDITDKLHLGAHNKLLELGALEKDIYKWEVPGSFELIYACSKVSQVHKLDALIAIGSLIKGETRHFEYVCEGVSQGIKEINLRGETPVVFCVLTDENKQQAIQRAGGKFGNKAIECAQAAVRMAHFRKSLEKKF